MQKQQGLTLIEVLIALAIISIALTAVIKAGAENIRFTARLQTKTIAIWIGQQVLNEARVGLLALPAGADQKEESVQVLGRDWHWRAQRKTTANKNIDKISVRVFEGEEQQQDQDSPVVTLDTFIYHAE